MRSSSEFPMEGGAQTPLSPLSPLTWKGDLAARMVAGIGKYLARQTRESIESRSASWRRDLASWKRYRRSVLPNLRRLAAILGVVDERQLGPLHAVAPIADPDDLPGDPFIENDPAVIAHGEGFVVRQVYWDVLPGVEGEGLLLEPVGDTVADVIALPDCDDTPEMLAGLVPGIAEGGQFARILAEGGCRVLIPTLINRQDTYSTVAGLRTNQPHREFIYRAGFEQGRHIIGYEVQKVLAGVDALGGRRPVGVIGYGEGGLVAFYAAALDERLAAVAVCGAFGPREGLYKEPIYRNVWSLLTEFGDAEIATLIAPRPLIVEACPVPAVAGPPPATEGRAGAAPGALTTPSVAAVEREIARARELLAGLEPPAPITLVKAATAGPGSEATLAALRRALNPSAAEPCRRELFEWTRAAQRRILAPLPDAEARQKRQFLQLLEHTQHVLREAEFVRRDYWDDADATDVETWVKSTCKYRKRLWEVLGPLPQPDRPPNPRGRKLYETEAFVGYEIALDVLEEVFTCGILLVPRDIRPGRRLPVVVCQHGLEGRPRDVADPSAEDNAYHQFACRLAERGFVTFSPQCPYIGGDDFRMLQRMANPLKLSLFSFIVRQHQVILQWLGSLPFVDKSRMAFYGLSYGGKTAMRVPAVLEDYCLSICSGDFDEWVLKIGTVRHSYSYMRTGEWEIVEWNLGNTFNYAEMSWLICPRPFMVERGHLDGVAPDEWVGYEYAKTRYRYDLLGIGDRTEIEFFNGPHEINGVGTFEFLDKHLRD